MKLRNKQTPSKLGKIVPYDNEGNVGIAVKTDQGIVRYYHSLAKLNEEWEDCVEPKYFYCISIDGSINKYEVERYTFESWCKNGAKIIGNYFETKEEAERAVEKLKAWKRLKDKGFEFDNFIRDGIYYKLSDEEIEKDDVIEDLDLLFGGEE